MLNNKMYRAAAVNQPTFLPWAGYFELLAKADVFIILDNVQFSKPSWQNRNRINSARGPTFISLPVRRNNLTDKLNEVIVLKDPCFFRIMNKIESSYRRFPYYKDLQEIVIEPLMEYYHSQAEETLADLNILLLKNLVDYLGFNCALDRASKYPDSNDKIQRLISLCTQNVCTTYMSPKGAGTYLRENKLQFEKNRIKVKLQNYCPAKYETPCFDYASHLSIIDIIAAHGRDSYVIIQNGFRDFESL